MVEDLEVRSIGVAEVGPGLEVICSPPMSEGGEMSMGEFKFDDY